MSRFDPIFGLMGTLLLAYGLDRWLLSLRETGFQTFNVVPYHRGVFIANVCLSSLLLWLSWLVYFRTPRSRMVAAFYLGAGLLLTGAPGVLALAPSRLPAFASPFWRSLRLTLLYSSPRSLLGYTGASLVVLGLLSLVPLQATTLKRLLGP